MLLCAFPVFFDEDPVVWSARQSTGIHSEHYRSRALLLIYNPLNYYSHNLFSHVY